MPSDDGDMIATAVSLAVFEPDFPEQEADSTDDELDRRSIGVVQWEGLGAVPVYRLDQCEIGERVMQEPIFHHPWGLRTFPVAIATVLYISPVGSGVEIVLDGAGYRQGEFETTRWACMTRVLKLDDIPQHFQFIARHGQREDHMATAQAAKALQARYNFQQAQLIKALSDENNPEQAGLIEKAQNAIAKIEADAASKGITLNANEATPVVTTAPPVPGATKTGKAKAAEDKRQAALEKHRDAQGEAKAATKSGGTSKPKGERKLRPCLEGCGQMVPGNFAMGHDAKLKSLILRIERGEEDPTSLPDVVKDLVKFKATEKQVERDAQGGVKSETQFYLCLEAPVKLVGRDEESFKLTQRSD